MIKSVAINTNTIGDNAIVAAAAGMRIRVVNYVLVPDATVAIKFTDGAGGADLCGPMKIGTTGLYPGWAAAMGPGSFQGHFETSQGVALVMNLGAGIQTSGYVNYTLEK